jgi:thioesterase domain-containing protein
MQCKIDIAVMIGSGVPQTLRAQGHKVCWVVLVNGEQRGSAFGSRQAAEECRSAWRTMFGLLESIEEQAAVDGELDEISVGAALKR